MKVYVLTTFGEEQRDTLIVGVFAERERAERDIDTTDDKVVEYEVIE